MLSKKVFCDSIRSIKEQSKINENFSKALETVGDGFFVFGAKNKLLDALLSVLKDGMSDKYDYIDWWLYETSAGYDVWDKTNDKHWVLDTPEKLYDFLVETSEEDVPEVKLKNKNNNEDMFCYKYKGTCLDMKEMQKISTYYEGARIAKLVMEKFPVVKTYDDAMGIGYDVCDLIARYGFTEDQAIEYVLKNKRKLI